MAGHKHAKLMALYAIDAETSEKPWLLWQFSGDSGWEDAAHQPGWVADLDYRRKPAMCRATLPHGRVIEWPKGEVNAPEIGDMHYMPTTYSQGEGIDPVCAGYTWNNCKSNLINLKRGMVHLTKENAIAHSRALILLSGGTLDG